MKKGFITRSVAFQVILYLILGVSTFVMIFGLFNCIWGMQLGLYHDSDYVAFQKRVLEKELEEMRLKESPFWYQADDASTEILFEQLEWLSDTYNVGYMIQDSWGRLLFSNINYSMKGSDYCYVVKYNRLNNKSELQEYRATIYIDPTFPKQDRLAIAYDYGRYCYNYRFVLIGAVVVSALLALFSFIWLICNAGYHVGEDKPRAGVFYKVPLELVGLVWMVGCAVIVGGIASVIYQYLIFDMVCVSVGLTVGSIWSMFYVREFAHRVKLGSWWKSTLAYGVLHLSYRILLLGLKLAENLIDGMPAVWPVILILAMVSCCEFFGIVKFNRSEIFILWVLEKMVVIPVVIYCVLAFDKLLKGTKAMAEGELLGKVNTKYLTFGFKEQGENLNQIGNGISKAVEGRIRSEKLKTELITNVSHDLKTPLTSVINYADLLGSIADSKEENKDEAIKEYSEVLIRQASRLKKLLDDLVDASKATTGNLEVNLMPCELGVLLTQAAGEYEEKFDKKQLILRVIKPEEDVRIMADGRHLWRIFDNLLNNICKYAKEDSRVYINVERKGNCAEIVFRNISKYELNISAEELEERFVRGDASRHMEGSGLGLSIAKSLAELQQGTLQIVTDGDLFKAVLNFPLI